MHSIDWNMVSAIGQVAGAAATVAAVVVSLQLARRSDRANLRIKCRLATTVPGTVAAGYVDIAIANLGSRTERITSLGFALRRRGASRLVVKPSVAMSRDVVPVEIAPGDDAQFAWTASDFVRCADEMRRWLRESRRLWILYPRVHVFVGTASGSDVVVPVSHSVQLLFASGDSEMFRVHELRVMS